MARVLRYNFVQEMTPSKLWTTLTANSRSDSLYAKLLVKDQYDNVSPLRLRVTKIEREDESGVSFLIYGDCIVSFWTRNARTLPFEGYVNLSNGNGHLIVEDTSAVLPQERKIEKIAAVAR